MGEAMTALISPALPRVRGGRHVSSTAQEGLISLSDLRQGQGTGGPRGVVRRAGLEGQQHFNITQTIGNIHDEDLVGYCPGTLCMCRALGLSAEVPVK